MIHQILVDLQTSESRLQSSETLKTLLTSDADVFKPRHTSSACIRYETMSSALIPVQLLHSQFSHLENKTSRNHPFQMETTLLLHTLQVTFRSFGCYVARLAWKQAQSI